MNKFKLQVVEGEQSGESFALHEGDNLLGRSRDARIRLRSSDVSSLHARLSVQGASVIVANISQFGTWIGERKLAGSESLQLEVGQTIKAGKNSLRLQVDAAVAPEAITGAPTAGTSSKQSAVEGRHVREVSATAATRPPHADLATTAAGSADTELPAAGLSTTGGSFQDYDKLMRAKAELVDLEDTGARSSGDMTRAQKTVFVPKEELDRRLHEEQKKGRKRVLLILGVAIPIMILLMVFFPKPAYEGKLEYDDSYDDGVADAPLGGFKIVYPKNGSSKIQPTADGLIVSTLLGRKQDVRLVITLQESISNKWATQSSETSLHEWIASHPDQTYGLPFGKFEGSQNGVWVWNLPYVRSNGSLVGETRLFFNGRHLEAISAEVPAENQGRAESMYKDYTYFEFPSGFEDSSWTGQSSTNHVVPSVIFSQIEIDLRRNAPLTWASIARQLQLVLCQSVAENVPTDEEQALRLLAALRQQQASWFNSQNLLYMNLTRGKDDRAVADLKHRCEAVFSDPADNRYFEVRKWKAYRE